MGTETPLIELLQRKPTGLLAVELSAQSLLDRGIRPWLAMRGDAAGGGGAIGSPFWVYVTYTDLS